MHSLAKPPAPAYAAAIELDRLGRNPETTICSGGAARAAVMQPTGDVTKASPVFTLADAHAAAAAWGANCGPGALAAVLGLSLDAVHPHLEKFDQKRYTNPSMMRGALKRLGVWHRWQVNQIKSDVFPVYGLARVQWDGPWTAPGVPVAAAYRHTHWVGAREIKGDGPVVFEPPYAVEIFDINCICVGGWVPLSEWSGSVVPWLLKQCEPKATGGWWLTHAVEITLKGR